MSVAFVYLKECVPNSLGVGPDVTNPALLFDVGERNAHSVAGHGAELIHEAGEAMDPVAIGIALDRLFGARPGRGLGRGDRRGTAWRHRASGRRRDRSNGCSDSR